MKRMLAFILLICFAISFQTNALCEKKISVGYTTQNLENSYFSSRVAGMITASKELDIDLIVYDAEGKSENTIKQIDALINTGVDAILVSPVEQEAAEEAVKRAQESGIPVISLDQEVVGCDVFFGIDEYESGYMVGKIAANWLNEKESDGTIGDILDENGRIQVAVGRYDSISSVYDRAEGMKKAVTECYTGEHEICFVGEYTAGSTDEGYVFAEKALKEHPRISVFLCINDAGALGVYQVCMLDKAHTAENTCIVGTDAADEALRLISENTMYKGTVDNRPAETGAEALYIALDLIDGLQVGNRIIFEMKPVTKANIADYVKD